MIHTILSALIDVLCPPPPEVLAIRELSCEQFLARRQRHHYNTVRVLSHYKDPFIRAAIHAHKFYAYQHATILLAALLQSELAELPTPVILISVPVSKHRKRTRGADHITTLLQATQSKHSIISDLLIRTRNTPQQSHLPRAERLTNLSGSFSYNTTYPPRDFEKTHIIIVDDVITTGTTLQEAAATVRHHVPASAKVSCLALAH